MNIFPKAKNYYHLGQIDLFYNILVQRQGTQQRFKNAIILKLNIALQQCRFKIYYRNFLIIAIIITERLMHLTPKDNCFCTILLKDSKNPYKVTQKKLRTNFTELDFKDSKQTNAVRVQFQEHHIDYHEHGQRDLPFRIFYKDFLYKKTMQSSSQKVISFALFLIGGVLNQKNEKYVIGIRKNIESAKQIFKDWIIHLHIDNSINGDLLKELQSHENVQIINHAKENQIAPVYDLLGKRFVCHDPSNVKALLVRDADNILTEKDYQEAGIWLQKRNEPIFRYFVGGRDYTFLGGAVGFKREIFKQVEERLEEFSKTINRNLYGWDEQFLDETFKHYDAYVITIDRLNDWSQGYK